MSTAEHSVFTVCAVKSFEIRDINIIVKVIENNSDFKPIYQSTPTTP